MMQTLYSLRTDGDQYRITKFVDGEVESSYLCTESECECPAGHRHTCRHRQMLPQMLAHGLTNSHWFWDFDRHYACDFQGASKALADALTDIASVHPQPIFEPYPTVGEALLVAEETKPEPKPIRLFGEGGLVTEYYKHADAEPEPAPQQQASRSWRRL